MTHPWLMALCIVLALFFLGFWIWMFREQRRLNREFIEAIKARGPIRIVSPKGAFYYEKKTTERKPH